MSCCDGDGDGERRGGGPPDSQVRVPGACRTPRLEEGGNLSQRTRAVRGGKSEGQCLVAWVVSEQSEQAGEAVGSPGLRSGLQTERYQAGQCRALPLRPQLTVSQSIALAGRIQHKWTLHFMSEYPIICTQAR